MYRTLQPFTTLVLALFAFGHIKATQPMSISVDVLVINGGTGGVSAGIQAARSGARTLLIEPSTWLGGMLSAAGVSAIDGNHRMPAGLWGEFRTALRTHYGSANALETGWVSNTLFEPHVGDSIWKAMAAREPHLEVWFQSNLLTIQALPDGWKIRVRYAQRIREIHSRILIDATDLGDVAAKAGVPFDLGMERAAQTGESFAPAQAVPIIQDLTYVAILKQYPDSQQAALPKPKGYDPAEFSCACREVCPDSTGVSCAQMLLYGKLPGNKYMINWPNSGNDFYTNLIGKRPREKRAALDSAKQQTLRFVYFIQHELGYNTLGLADDEFPTEDRLPFYPYHREGRRIRGVVRVQATHITHPYQSHLYRTGGIVGDYPIDHHHKKQPLAPAIQFPPVPSFNLPLGALIPATIPNLLIADKAISVSNIVNGSSRLQPVVLQIGQAAGLMAALAVQQQCTPAQLSVRLVQEQLLAAGGWLLPFFDVPAEDPHFRAIQRMGACGILQGRGEPYQWANRTWFNPSGYVSRDTLLQSLPNAPDAFPSGTDTLYISDALALIQYLQKDPATLEAIETSVSQHWSSWGLSHFYPQRPITRRELAVLFDATLHPFAEWPIDWEGNFIYPRGKSEQK